MMKYLYLVLLVVTLGYGDLDKFADRQDVLQKIKQMIIDEESIAKAYEAYIIKNYSLPSSLAVLKTADYLGTTFGNVDETYFNSFVLATQNVSYRLKDNLSSIENFKLMYESDTYRKKTFVYKGKVYFKLEDDFAKNLFMLIKTQGSGLNNCNDIPKRQYCIKDNHIYLFTNSSQSKIIMYYYVDKFKTGPIVISNDTSLYDTRSEFKYLPYGTFMYDLDGIKYVKTSSSIEKVK